MILILVLPAAASVLALAALARLARRVDIELIELRAALRRMAATGVASDELRRHGAETRDRALATGTSARLRMRRPRLVGLQPPR